MYRHILVPLDLRQPKAHTKILDTVQQHFCDARAALHLVTVLPHDESLGILSQFIPEGFEEAQEARALESLEQIAAGLDGRFASVTPHVRSGNVYVEVLAQAEQAKADLIILGAHKPELKDYLLGPSAARIMRHADCSVLVVR